MLLKVLSLRHISESATSTLRHSTSNLRIPLRFESLLQNHRLSTTEDKSSNLLKPAKVRKDGSPSATPSKVHLTTHRGQPSRPKDTTRLGLRGQLQVEKAHLTNQNLQLFARYKDLKEMADDHITPTANILGTIGTVMWCVQLLPQIWKNYRNKSTDGLGAMMLVWALCLSPSVPRTGIYVNIIQLEFHLVSTLSSRSSTSQFRFKPPSSPAYH